MFLATALTAILSLSGGFALLLGSKKLAKIVQKFGTYFSILVLFAVVFFDIIPEILEEETLSAVQMVIFVFCGLVFCFIVSFFAGHFHKHGDEHTFHDKKQALAMLIVDSLHTVVDGIVLGTSFVAGLGTGFLTALATTAHEIPQEIGDFSIMLRAKMPVKKIAKLQIISGLVLIPSAIVAYFVGDKIEPHLPTLLSFIAGFFLYIALGEIWSIISRVRTRKK